MNIRRSFFISLPLGLLVMAVVYFGAFYFQAGAPISRYHWLHEIIERKCRLTAAVPSPKLLIVGGSSAWFGIDAEQIERKTGCRTANFGTCAALPPSYMLHLAKQICRPGDTVLFAFEYELYAMGNDLSGASADDLFISYIQAYDRDYVLAQDRQWQIRLALFTPGTRLWKGVLAAIWSPKPDAGSEKTSGILSDVNSHGDYLGAIPSKREANPEARTALCGSLAFGLPDSPAGFPPIREFCEWARQNHIRLLATFPNLCHRPEYDLPPATKAPAQLREFYASLGVPMLGDPSEVILPEAQFFDSMYHPMRDAAIARTERLLVHLAPYLKPQPGAR